MRAHLLVALAVLACAPAVARAAEPPRALAASSGLLLTIAPMSVGAAMLASPAGLDRPVGAVTLIAAGFTLAPVVAHAIVGEWDRAALFGAVPLATSVVMVALAQARDDILVHATKPTRVSFYLAWAIGLLTSGAGVIDVFAVRERHQPPALAILPSIGAGRAELVVGGVL